MWPAIYEMAWAESIGREGSGGTPETGGCLGSRFFGNSDLEVYFLMGGKLYETIPKGISLIVLFGELLFALSFAHPTVSHSGRTRTASLLPDAEPLPSAGSTVEGVRNFVLHGRSVRRIRKNSQSDSRKGRTSFTRIL